MKALTRLKLTAGSVLNLISADYGIGAQIIGRPGNKKNQIDLPNIPSQVPRTERLWSGDCGQSSDSDSPNEENLEYLKTKKEKMGHCWISPEDSKKILS
jgi:GTP cyclohydrolase II